MKTKPKAIHNHHSKKRLILELIGLGVLVAITAMQWSIMQDAIDEIKMANMVYVITAVVVYWFLLPLTPISFRLLSDKRLNIWTTTLAQLAGSGPGRIVPGGLGRLSLSVVHLIKLGFKSSKAIIVTVTSNIVGVFTNLIILLLIFILEPTSTSFFNKGSIVPFVLIILASIFIVFCVFSLLLRIRKTKRGTRNLLRKWRLEIKHIRKNPKLFFKLVLIALLILTGYVAMLILSSVSLGINLSLSNALIALSIGVFAGGIIPTPGGVGGVEAGIVTTLVIMGYTASEATSIALLFRAITYWQPLIPGTVAYIYLRKRKLL